MQRHLDVATFQVKATSRRVEMTVVVGNATVDASNDAPQVIARAVPLSVNEIQSVSPFTGVPLKLVVMLVIA
jgi:hypothetical protein